MRNYWVISDTHLNHNNILTYEPIHRPFSSVEEMNETIIQNWNSVVKDNDNVYHLGDVCFGNLDDFITNIAPRLNGRITLILGNHDPKDTKKLIKFLPVFREMHMWYIFSPKKLLFSHVPQREEQFRGGCSRNVHGHMHGKTLAHPLYANVCVERTGHFPVNIDEIDKYFNI